MKLIKDVEIAYFRSFYKERLSNLSDLSVIFGRNDAGKSNVLRALNLFFNQQTNPNYDFDFRLDFNHKRQSEADEAGKRKFIYVKITFATPENYRASLGPEFSIKRQWNTWSGQEYHQEISKNVPNSRHQYVTRLLNQIHFHYIPAVKDRGIFAWLFQKIYATIAKNADFSGALTRFSDEIQTNTDRLFSDLEPLLGFRSALAAPSNMRDLFGALDVDTNVEGSLNKLSLILQRGDGLQVRHIPEILKFISDNDEKKYHLWGFEEPENSLELAFAFAEAKRFVSISKEPNKQLIVTSHSPPFFLIEDDVSTKFFVNRSSASSTIRSINSGKDDALSLMGDNFFLPMISKSVQSAMEEVESVKASLAELNSKYESSKAPLLFVEGITDKIILESAHRKLFGKECGVSIEALGGTQRMKALCADGAALTLAANDRKIFVLTDNDFDGRETSPKGQPGKWLPSRNGVLWWRLMPTNEYCVALQKLSIDQEMYYFAIEDCFTSDLRLKAKEIMSGLDETYKYGGVRQYPKKIDHHKLFNATISDAVTKFCLFAPEKDTKELFAKWLDDQAADEFSYFKNFFDELRLKL